MDRIDLITTSVLGLTAKQGFGTPCLVLGLVFAWLNIGLGEAPPQELLISVYSYLDDPSSLGPAKLAAELRPFGIDALDRLFAVQRLLERDRDNARDISQRVGLTTRTQRLELLCDAVAAQRWSRLSRLFWYTDLDDARHAARRLGRPLISLRLEGQLIGEQENEDALLLLAGVYGNQCLADELRDGYVLHWQQDLSRSLYDIDSESKLHAGRSKVVTFNPKARSRHVVHYLLTNDGIPVAALPRCVSATCLSSWLRDFQAVARRDATDRKDLHNQIRALHRTAHKRRTTQLAVLWKRSANTPSDTGGALSAPSISVPPDLEQWSAERWDYLIGQVRQHAGTNCQLDQQSRELIASVEFARAYGGSHVPDAEQCESRLALGTTRAQFQDLFVIDNWFDSDDFPIDVELLNAKIFQTFFR